jgi:hypothetical protein
MYATRTTDGKPPMSSPGDAGDSGGLPLGVPESLVNNAHSYIAVSPQAERLRGIRHWLSWRWPMPHYYFDIKDGHRFVDASGLDLRNDDAAIAKAKVLAIGVSIDKPEVDPKRHIAVLNGSREQIFSVPVYSKPSMSTT